MQQALTDLCDTRDASYGDKRLKAPQPVCLPDDAQQAKGGCLILFQWNLRLLRSARPPKGYSLALGQMSWTYPIADPITWGSMLAQLLILCNGGQKLFTPWIKGE